MFALEMNSDIISLGFEWFLHVVNRARYMLYLVFPSETMYPSLDVVPRYVAEVCKPHDFKKKVSKIAKLTN